MTGREIGRTRTSGFQAGARATLEVAAARLWDFIVSPEGQAMLGSASVPLTERSDGVTTFVAGSHFRRLVRDDSGFDWMFQVRVIEALRGRSTLALHAERLPDSVARIDALRRFGESIGRVRAAVSAQP